MTAITRLQRRSEDPRGHERLAEIQKAMARWLEKMAERQDKYEGKRNARIDARIQG